VIIESALSGKRMYCTCGEPPVGSYLSGWSLHAVRAKVAKASDAASERNVMMERFIV